MPPPLDLLCLFICLHVVIWWKPLFGAYRGGITMKLIVIQCKPSSAVFSIMAPSALFFCMHFLGD